MKLLYDRVHVREVGFPPSKIQKLGLKTTWSFATMLREHTSWRVGLILATGNDCKDVLEGQVVLYNKNYARTHEANGKEEFFINEDNIHGIYSNVKQTKKGLQMSEISFQPLGDRVLVEREVIKKKDTEKGTLVMPEKVNAARRSRGVIIAVGVGKGAEDLTVSVGDKIVFGTGAGIELELEEGTYVLMREGDVFGILNK